MSQLGQSSRPVLTPGSTWVSEYMYILVENCYSLCEDILKYTIGLDSPLQYPGMPAAGQPHREASPIPGCLQKTRKSGHQWLSGFPAGLQSSLATAGPQQCF